MELSDKLSNIVAFAKSEDGFGNFSAETTLVSVVFGTLRKDLQIADDLCVLMTNASTGIAMIALCRILVEDYIHLSYLINSQEGTESLLMNIEKHPKVEAYLKAYTLKEWGIELTEQEERTLTLARNGFDRNKADFLRHGRESETFNSDDYYRTWTKKPLAVVIRDSGVSDGETRSEMGLIKQLYDIGSDIIHHNAYLIWHFSRGNTDTLFNGLPQASSAFALSTLAKIVNISLQVKYADNAELHETKLNELTDLI